MFISNIPSYDINLSASQATRWRTVIAKDLPAVKRLVRVVKKEFEAAPEGIQNFLLNIAEHHGDAFDGGRYTGEMRAWAHALGLPLREIRLINALYEISHLAEAMEPMGCTAAIMQHKTLGPLHVRSLDWPLPVGKATRIFNINWGGQRQAVIVGIAGFLGALSGMVPGAYSACINWAAPLEMPALAMSPTFLLRYVLENCNTFEAAVEELTFHPLSTSVFFTVCGAKKDQAVIIERTQDDAQRRWPSILPGNRRMKRIVQGNHYTTPKFRNAEAEPDELVENSEERITNLHRALQKAEIETLDDAGYALDADEVLNEDTEQQMVFAPALSDFKVWRWV